MHTYLLLMFKNVYTNSPGLWPLACSNPFVPFSTCLTLSFLVLLSFCRPLLSFDACVYLGPPPGAAAPESPPPELEPFAPFLLKIAPWTDFSEFLKLLKGAQFQHRFRFAFFLTPDPFLTDFGSHFDVIFAKFTCVFCIIIFTIFVASIFVDLYQLLHAKILKIHVFSSVF